MRGNISSTKCFELCVVLCIGYLACLVRLGQAHDDDIGNIEKYISTSLTEIAKAISTIALLNSIYLCEFDEERCVLFNTLRTCEW